MVRRPSRLAVRAIRTAISPRLAIRTEDNIKLTASAGASLATGGQLCRGHPADGVIAHPHVAAAAARRRRFPPRARPPGAAGPGPEPPAGPEAAAARCVPAPPADWRSAARGSTRRWARPADAAAVL